ncbi:MAG: hypothetical protein KJO64_07765, partial [Bacteroidia bacterium]|nr:hypothetical protein [Bacteroidia bacterium]
MEAISQSNTPCNCTTRWTRGAHWNADGTINDNNNAPSPYGIINCGSSGQAQTKLKPVLGCTYDSIAFNIDVSTIDCFDPSTGSIVYPLNPTNGEPIIWLNFDVRPLAGYFQIQINDNSNDNIAWALYHSTVITNGVLANPNLALSDSISGSCSSLSLVAGGVESSNTWNTLPVPNFVNTTNYYLAIWDQGADGHLWVNNFKARYGCGDAQIPNVLCFLETGNPYIQVYPTENIYSVKIPVTGINNELYAYDPNSINANGLSSSVCLTNLGEANPHLFDTLILDYNFNDDYSITVFSAGDSITPVSVTPDTLCHLPYNTGDCRATFIGSGTALP